jgi:hypothetical protein
MMKRSLLVHPLPQQYLPIASLRTHPFNLRHAVDRLQPSNSFLDKLLSLRSQLRLVQFVIVNSADSAEAETGETTATTVHERATNGAERASHGVPGTDGFAGRVGSELVFAANVH